MDKNYSFRGEANAYSNLFGQKLIRRPLAKVPEYITLILWLPTPTALRLLLTVKSWLSGNVMVSAGVQPGFY